MSQYLGFQPTKNPNYYFVSYNNEDADRVGAITQKIAESGIDLWYDHGIDYGTDWETVITERIEHAQAIVLFFTEGILHKKHSYVQKEYKIATEFYDKQIFVVLLDQINKEEVPSKQVAWWTEINEMQCIPGYEYKDTDSLAQDIVAALQGKDKAGLLPIKRKRKKKKNGRFGWVLPVLLSLLIIAGATFGALAISRSLGDTFSTLNEFMDKLFSNSNESSTEEQSTEEQTELHVHAYGDWGVIVNPTCEAQGEQ